MTTAAEVGAMLTRHYLPEGRPPAGVLAFEIGSPCGSRRADAMWAPHGQNSGGLAGHEIKVSRADVLVELADPAKADPWLRYCSRWWLTVSDPALVDGLEDRIPEAWGIMSPPSGRRTRSMTIVRQAPKLKPVSPAPAYARLLTWATSRHETLLHELRWKVKSADTQAERDRQTILDLRATRGHRSDPNAVRVAKILDDVKRRAEREWLWERVTDGDVIEALLDTLRSRQIAAETRQALDRLVREVREAADPLAGVAEKLERIAAGQPINERHRP